MGLISDIVTARTGIMKRLGKVFGAIKRVEAFQSDIVDNSGQSFQEIINEYITATDATANTNLKLIGGITQNHDFFRNSIGTTILPRLYAAAEMTLIEMVNDEVPLKRKDVRSALFELRRLMAAGSKTMDATTITIGSTTKVVGASTLGVGVVVSAEADNTYHSTMASYPTCRTELLTFTCVQDATSKGVVKGGELFEIRGAEKHRRNDHRWPGGSGNLGVYPATSELLADGMTPGRNILRNSGFEVFDSSDKSTGWAIATGSTSTILANSSGPIHGSKSVQFRSDGTNTLFLRQKTNSKGASGTMAQVKYDDLYCVSFWMNRANTSPSAGELTVGLMQADGTAVTDSTTTIAHGAINTAATQYTFTFRAGGGSALPDDLYFGIRQSTAFTSGTYLNIDRLVFTKMISTGPGGVSCAIVPGTTDFKLGDQFTVQVTNNGEGEMLHYFDKCFDTYNLGIHLPSATTSETVDDALVS